MSTLFDLVAMSVSSAFGTSSTIPLGAAATISGVTYLSFAGAGAAGGTAVLYSILDSSASEIGTATYTSSNTTLTARTPTKSTNANAAINASSAAIITATVRAEDLPLLSSPNIFTAAQTATQWLPTVASTTAWGLDYRNVTLVVGPSSFANLATGSGIIALTDGSITGQTGLYITGGSAATFLGASGTAWVASSSSPAASKYSIAFSTGSQYAIFNGNTTTTVTFTLAMISARNTN